MITAFQVTSSMDGLNDLQDTLEDIGHSWELPGKFLLEINLILEELCANFIEHAGEKSPGLLDIALNLDGSDLVITVKDDGPPFDPRAVSDPDINLPLDDRSPGGLGLHFVKHYSDHLSYIRKQDKNILTITKKIE